ncbi:OPT oligopeptide transporter protein-domain-containing protein [Mycena olivaceomarginata]|nr:OPT oligopeptide transporter protein-domain-containing protein [Mycena olivaceomarginata]
MSETPAADNNSRSTSSINKTLETEKVAVTEVDSEEDVNIGIISTYDDPTLPSITFRSILLGVGLSAFSSVTTIYTFKPQNASVSQLFCLIIAYVLGTAMHSVIPSHGVWRYLNPGPFNLKEHTVITIMSGTASNVATGMEIIAALDLFYDLRFNAAVAIFQILATQMVGYGIFVIRTFLVYPTYAFYPNYISGVNLLRMQSLDWRGTLNAKKRRFFWIVFAAIFFWEWIPQYPMPILTAIYVIFPADNGRHEFVRNLFGAGSSNEGIGLLSVSTSWTLITQGTPLVWPFQTPFALVGMWLGYIVLTTCYYSNVFNSRDLPFMSTSLFSETGDTYNQSEVITTVGLPRYSTTYAISRLCYNLSLGAAVTYLFLWRWPELRSAFGGIRFLKRGHAEVDDPHYKAEVPQWVYALLFFVSIGVVIGRSYAGPHGKVLMPAWYITFFTVFSAIISVFLGFSKVLVPNGCLRLMHRSPITIMAVLIHPGNLSIYRLCTELTSPVMYANLYGNSTSFQSYNCIILTIIQLTDLKLGQYTKLPPRITDKIIVSNNRAILVDPIGSRLWSGWIASIAMGALGKELFAFGKRYWLIPFAMHLAKFMKYLNLPIILLYIGWLPYSVNGQWTSCMIIGVYSQWWLRTRRPKWFAKYNYILSAALDGGSQVILFILSFAVFSASGKAIMFPSW